MESVVRILIGLNVPIVRKSGPKSMKIKQLQYMGFMELLAGLEPATC